MSDLRPNGVTVIIGEEAHSLLFTLNVIDSLQSTYGETVGTILHRLADPQNGPAVLRYVMTELLNDENRRKKRKRFYQEEEVGSLISIGEIPKMNRAIIAAYSGSMPENDEDEDLEEDAELLDIAQILVIAISKMGYDEKEAFEMTPRKFFVLLGKYLELNGKKKELRGIDALP